MAVISSVSPTASVTLSVGNTSARIQIPTAGTPTVALITNFSQSLVFLAFGDNTVVAAVGGVPLMPGTQLPITISGFTYVAGISLGPASTINVTTCT